MKMVFLVAVTLASPVAGQGLVVAPRPAVHELKDANGQLLRRVVFQTDGSLDTQSFIYEGTRIRVSDEEHLDSSRKPVRKLKESFDSEGRITEREETSAKGGRMVGTRTLYQYDARGRRSEEKTAIE